MTYRKIGGLRFLTLGRLQISWCWKRPKAMQRPTRAELRRVLPKAPQLHVKG